MALLIVRPPDGSERRIPLRRRLTSVGLSPESDVPVPDPSLPGTALHLHFDGRDYDVACHDGASMTVNGRRRATCRLAPGDRIRVALSAYDLDRGRIVYRYR